MPKWAIHEKVCLELLGYYIKEVDVIVDNKFKHDSSRYDVDDLVRTVDYVRNRFGKRGLKQLIMHHYLDRIGDMIVSQMVGGVLSPQMLDSDPNNILNLLIHPYEYLEGVARDIYSNKKRKKSIVIARLYRANQKLKEYPELESLRPMVMEIVDILKKNLSFVIDEITKDEKIGKRANIAMIMKNLGPRFAMIMIEVKRKYQESLSKQNMK